MVIMSNTFWICAGLSKLLTYKGCMIAVPIYCYCTQSSPKFSTSLGRSKLRMATEQTSLSQDAGKPGTLRNRTEPEVIVAQYGHGHRICYGKLVSGLSMYGELISRPVPVTKTGQGPSRQYRPYAMTSLHVANVKRIVDGNLDTSPQF